MSDLLRMAIVFIVILILLRRKYFIGYVMIGVSAVLAVLYRMPPERFVETAKNALLSPTTLKLLLSLSLIRIFENVLRRSGVLAEMLESIKGLFSSRRIVIVSMPILIGMLPSLGGAYFSAPMVAEASEGLDIGREEKAFINYWFRHPWEFILPLYPGIILAAAVSNTPLYDLVLADLPYAAALICAGFVFSMRGLGGKSVSRSRPDFKGYGRKLMSFLPVGSVLLLVAVARLQLHVALLIVIPALLIRHKYRMSDLPGIARHGFAAEVIVLISGIMMFKETMEVSGAVRNLGEFFISEGIPVLPILFFLPFIAGLLTGHTVGCVGSSFPLIVTVAGSSLHAISFAFASGFIGVMLSPVHLCLVLTREYFRADMHGIYIRIIPAAVSTMAVALVVYLALR